VIKNKVKTNATLEDKIGEYIPFCEYKFHRGVLKRKYAKNVCEYRGCKHYSKVYLPLNEDKG